ncbi:NACHT domain-containing protein 2 [Elsinoe fawcettii]|nr:NACHT domain-containing protein 2 [Elsinoe fawcettii]
MAASSLNRDLFTIGWVCALQIEYLAARAFLENKCDLDSQESADNNAYTLGNIGKHHVVLAACPDGEYGIASAANVARDLARSFPRVRVGLLVGIGGGIPSKQHDIRLGDVVVSSQAGRTAAVVQYDMGKQLSDGTFQSTGQLDNPPASLRAALVKLQSVQDEEGNGLTKAIDQTLRSMRESLRAKYCRPQDGTDVLFRADVVHSSNQDGDCVDVCGSGADSLIWRKHRTSSDDTPAVHYGPIGSGNTVMKDAITRDALGQSHGIICFEMEAAGLMNTWPCVVIRGICDYADSHKNKHWQRYAALAAAAYARALILTLAPRQVETSTTIAEILARSEEHSQTLDRIERQVTTASQQRQTEYLRSWLQPVDPSTNYNKARSLRHDGTGDWLIKTEAFREWLSTPKSFLWLYGRPGCGKTVLSSTILSAISDDGKKWSKILYFYYDFADVNKQSMDSTLRTLLCQLAEMDEQHAEAIREFWHDHNDGSRQPGKEEMYAVLRRELQAAGEVYILLDALDECTTRGAGGSLSLLDWLKQLHQDVKGLRLLCTSRPESDIEESFLSWVPQESRISIRGEEVSSDIDAYVYAAVREFAGLQRWHDRPEVQDLICHTLSSKADGM